METIAELREKLQSEKLEMRKGILGYRFLRRGISIYFTRVLISTNVRPNQITVMTLVSGVAGAACMFFGWLWLGFFLLYLNIVLDAVDGEVARYKKLFSLRGAYLDLVNHLAIPGLFFLATTFFVADVFNAPNIPVLIAGILGAFALPLLRANGDIPSHVFVEIFSKNPEKFPLVARANIGATTLLSPRNPLHFAYHLRHFSIMLVVFFLAFLAELLFFPGDSGRPILSPLVVVYAAFLWVYLAREIVSVFFSVENRISGMRNILKGREKQ